MDELEDRVAQLRRQEDLDAIRPDLDGRQIMQILDLKPGPQVGRAYRHMLDYRLDQGPVDQQTAEQELQDWWQREGADQA